MADKNHCTFASDTAWRNQKKSEIQIENVQNTQLQYVVLWHIYTLLPRELWTYGRWNGAHAAERWCRQSAHWMLMYSLPSFAKFKRKQLNCNFIQSLGDNTLHRRNCRKREEKIYFDFDVYRVLSLPLSLSFQFECCAQQVVICWFCLRISWQVLCLSSHLLFDFVDWMGWDEMIGTNNTTNEWWLATK